MVESDALPGNDARTLRPFTWQDEAASGVPADGYDLGDCADRKRAIDMRIVLTARLGSLVANDRLDAIAVDDKYYEFVRVGVAVDKLGHRAKLVPERAVDEALLGERHAPGRHPVLTRSHRFPPGDALGDVQKFGHAANPVTGTGSHTTGFSLPASVQSLNEAIKKRSEAS